MSYVDRSHPSALWNNHASTALRSDPFLLEPPTENLR